jgi:hypothetical protein
MKNILLIIVENPFQSEHVRKAVNNRFGLQTTVKNHGRKLSLWFDGADWNDEQTARVKGYALGILDAYKTPIDL